MRALKGSAWKVLYSPILNKAGKAFSNKNSSEAYLASSRWNEKSLITLTTGRSRKSGHRSRHLLHQEIFSSKSDFRQVSYITKVSLKGIVSSGTQLAIPGSRVLIPRLAPVKDVGVVMSRKGTKTCRQTWGLVHVISPALWLVFSWHLVIAHYILCQKLTNCKL